ncbi:MAG TPA: lytic transglycosylase domain-containing protein [Puia sp.]|nr:lytic transglycosylase domain-containing protein [Puia sp.]
MLKVPVYLTLVIGLPTATNSGQPSLHPAKAAPQVVTVSYAVIKNSNDFILPKRHSMKFVDAYIRNNDEDLALVKKRSVKPFVIMDSVFKRYGIPPELKYLAVIESELKTTAVSRVGATGPWQLMAGTARELGLKVNGRYDERTNYYKSTKAAAKYLRDLHNEFKDWLLVLAAYNAGPLPVYKAIHRSNSRDFWALERYLPKETRGHVKHFIATAIYFQESREMEKRALESQEMERRALESQEIDSHEIAIL